MHVWATPLRIHLGGFLCACLAIQLCCITPVLASVLGPFLFCMEAMDRFDGTICTCPYHLSLDALWLPVGMWEQQDLLADPLGGLHLQVRVC